MESLMALMAFTKIDLQKIVNKLNFMVTNRLFSALFWPRAHR